MPCRPGEAALQLDRGAGLETERKDGPAAADAALRPARDPHARLLGTAGAPVDLGRVVAQARSEDDAAGPGIGAAVAMRDDRDEVAVRVDPAAATRSLLHVAGRGGKRTRGAGVDAVDERGIADDRLLAVVGRCGQGRIA